MATDRFAGEIRTFAFAAVPAGWARCDGQLLARADYPELFCVVGTAYGAGDGSTTFGLPDLRGRVPMGHGQGLGLSARTRGESGGQTEVSLALNQAATHRHGLQAFSGRGGVNSKAPAAGRSLAASQGYSEYAPGPGASPALSPTTVLPVGNGQPHNNLMPYTVFNMCIALTSSGTPLCV